MTNDSSKGDPVPSRAWPGTSDSSSSQTPTSAKVWPSASWTPPSVSARVGSRDESAAAFQRALERYMRVHSEDVAIAFEALLMASETGDVENVTGCAWDGSRQVAEHIVQRIESLPSPDRRQGAASHVR